MLQIAIRNTTLQQLCFVPSKQLRLNLTAVCCIECGASVISNIANPDTDTSGLPIDDHNRLCRISHVEQHVIGAEIIVCQATGALPRIIIAVELAEKCFADSKHIGVDAIAVTITKGRPEHPEQNIAIKLRWHRLGSIRPIQRVERRITPPGSMDTCGGVNGK